MAAAPSSLVILISVPVTVIGSVVVVAVVAYLLGVERVWPNAAGAISAKQARTTIVVLIIMPPLLMNAHANSC